MEWGKIKHQILPNRRRNWQGEGQNHPEHKHFHPNHQLQLQKRTKWAENRFTNHQLQPRNDSRKNRSILQRIPQIS